ncbi:hypothetical protein A1O3_00925 [Capronia epimyces CBS 606.96]|uniref:Uncharacterized protein n=1 Tax=Capronia epimyces CBS 606.96 TaxID=1182542 RepID=W9YRW5_9EURO|nr:uncharacterized protein A1O3_00925 [Capronia epimyces CBS 606.96]EXJ92375.1 hypothetical protein A1O3_00925 [Capronia epimyces CBS 606.96]
MSTGEGDQGITSAMNSQNFRQPDRTNKLDSRMAQLSIASQLNDSRRESSLGVTRPISVASLMINTTAAQQNVASIAWETTQDHTGHLPQPPAARRAASTGAISSQGESSHSRDASRPASSSRHGSWLPGMPLPGPPPGPPPSSSRSQSATGVRSFARVHNTAFGSQPNNYRVPLRPPVLSPLPPTPANWSDDISDRPAAKAPMPLHIETTNLDRPVSFSGALSRSSALRVSSAKGLLERRKNRRSVYEGQAAESSALTIETDPWADAISPSVYSNDPSPTLESTGAGALDSETRMYGIRTPGISTQHVQLHEGRSSPYLSTNDRSSSFTTAANTGIGARRAASKALPTPPLSQKNPTSAHSVLPSTASSVSELGQGEIDPFIAEASHRHHEFLLQESHAASDLERLQLFVDFMVEESQIRRQRYPAPFVEGNFDMEAAKQLLFDGGTSDIAMETSLTSHKKNASGQQGTEIDVSQRPEGLWWNEFRPALSPIASMSNDELSSRGRTASQWWQSQTRSESDGVAKKMKRTKRESKYMGLSTLSVEEILSEAATPRDSHETYQADDAYPEEKANPDTLGIYGDEVTHATTYEPLADPPALPLLDISRFITLPPPYPRHYPAITNGHPRLATYRNAVRALSDLNELENRRSRYQVAVEALRAEHVRKSSERQQSFQVQVQVQIKEGSITYAEAAEAEQALRTEDHKAEKACLQAEFDTLQDVLINPMHDMLNDRVAQLSAGIKDLTEELGVEMHAQNVDRAQQEGDAMPEILEYLTQLKWLFETREHMHREIFDLLSERNNKYKAIVLLPYRQVHNLDKIRDTEGFFTQDGFERRKSFFAEAVVRCEDFVRLVAENVAQEVELQSSAFWDIAPGLHDLVQRLPDAPEQLGAIAIPESEYAENPSYHTFPQQYLYSLLEHADKSTYQFIESQISLHCLLHEVKGALIGAQYRASEAADATKAADKLEDASPDSDLKRWRDEQEASATAELKQQVTVIEEQWSEALGRALQAKKAQVKMCLESVGGWDESLQGEG